jgi:hypothetical protein
VAATRETAYANGWHLRVRRDCDGDASLDLYGNPKASPSTSVSSTELC